MKSLSRFQLIILAFFIVGLVAGVVALAISRGSDDTKAGRIVVWGTMSEKHFNDLIGVAVNQPGIVNASYSYKKSETIYQAVLEAIASGKSPDALILTQDEIYRFRGKILTVPYTSYNERLYKDTFIEGTEIFTNNDGIDAFPIAVDPIIMYWNRDIFNAFGYQKPPQYWEELYNFAKNVTRKDSNMNIVRSAVGLGESVNIDHAKEILSVLIYQSGGRVSFIRNNILSGGLGETFNNPRNPTQASVDFYTQFSSPQKSTYTWNRTLPRSKDFFISGDLAIYFGYASEFDEIRKKNPNLNFDVSMIPQARGSLVPTTYGSYRVFVILRSTSNAVNATAAIGTITSNQVGRLLVSKTPFLPVRRDLVSTPQAQAERVVMYRAAASSRSWIDPDDSGTDQIFDEMISIVTSGRMGVSEAVTRASLQFNNILQK